MFCKNCGAENPDGALFCTSCGGALQNPAADQPAAPVMDMAGQPEINLNTQGQVKERNLLPLLAGIAVAAIALIVLVVLNFSTILSWFGVMPEPRVQLNNALKNGINSTFDDYDLLMENMSLFSADPVSAAGDIKLNISDSLSQSIAGLGFGEETVNMLKGINIAYQSTVNGKQSMITAALQVNGEALVNLSYILDAATGKQFISIPEMNEKAISIDFSELVGEMSLSDPEMITDLLNSDKIKPLFLRYMEIAVNGLTSVERVKETITVEGVSQELYVLNCVLTQADAQKMVLNIMETMKNDQDIKGLIQDAEPLMKQIDETVTADTVYQQFQNSLTDAIEDLKETDTTEGIEKITFDVMLSGKDLAGFRMDIPDTEESISIAYVKDGKQFAYQCNADTMVITGSGEDNGKDGITGNYIMAVEGNQMFAIGLEKFVAEKEQASGSITVKLGKELLTEIVDSMELGISADTVAMTDPALKITLNSTKENAEVTVALLISGAEMFGITGQSHSAEPAAITIPENFVNAMDDEAMDQWMSESGIADLLGMLVGVPSMDDNDYAEFEY